MATIEKLTGKTGTTYRITVYSGFDTQGKRIRHRQTYEPDPGRLKRPSRGPLRTLSGVLSKASCWTTGRPSQAMPPMCWI